MQWSDRQVNDPAVTIRFDGNGHVYYPGETLSGEYRLHAVDAKDIKAIEVSLLWYTSGKGDQDLAVHDFRRFSAENGNCIDPGRHGRFSSILPNSPLSYDGVIVKLRWCIRVRVFLSGGKQLVREKPFQLGHVPAAKVTRS